VGAHLPLPSPGVGEMIWSQGRVKKVGMEPGQTKLPLQVKAGGEATWPEQDGRCEMFENNDTGNNIPGTMGREKDKMQGSW